MELLFYLENNGIGPARVKQSSSNWQLYGNNYADTKNEYAKNVGEFLTSFTRDFIRPSSSCVSYLTKLTQQCAKEMSEADDWAMIYFNSLAPEEERKTGKTAEDDVWAFTVSNQPGGYTASAGEWVTILRNKSATKNVEYGDGKYSLSNWNNFERTYKIAHCTLKKLMNYIQGLNIGEGDVKFITPPFSGTTVFAPPYVPAEE